MNFHINPNLVQFLILIAFIGFSALAWVARKLHEQALLRQARQEQERRRLESIRTGRPMKEESQAATPQQRLAQLAARREARMREVGPGPAGPKPQVRVPSQARPQGMPARVGSPRPVPPRVPGQTTMRMPPRVQPPTVKTPAQRRLEMIEARRRALEARERLARPRAPEPPPAVVPESKASATESRHYEAPIPIAHMVNKPAKPKARIQLDKSKLRDAFILKELLDPPLSVREEGEG